MNVDKGMEDGQKITFSEEGDQEPGLEPGDIMIVLDEKQHDVSFFSDFYLVPITCSWIDKIQTHF